MNKKVLWAVFVLVAAAELFLLVWIRGEYRTVEAEGKEFLTPVAVDFRRNFHETNYIALHMPIQKAQWKDANEPVVGEEIYISIRENDQKQLEVLGAGLTKPSGDYIKARATAMDKDIVHFDFPADRLYLSSADLARVPVSELSERIRVKDPDTGKTVSRMKNEITARLRVKDGHVVIQDLLVNGNPIQTTFATVGKNVNIKYATSDKEKDQIIPAGEEIK